MPAKQKYLSSPWQRALKISAAILGGYLVSAAFHTALAAVFPYKEEIFLSATFTLFLIWAILMVLAFAVKSGWKIWGLYLLLILIFSLLTYIFK